MDAAASRRRHPELSPSGRDGFEIRHGIGIAASNDRRPARPELFATTIFPFTSIVMLSQMMTATHANRSEDLVDRGVGLMDHGHCRRALVCFRRAMDIDPGNELASYNAGVACHGMRNYGRAVSFYQLAIQMFPEFVQAHHNLAQAYSAQRQFAPAIDAYRQALDLDAGDFKSAYNLSLLYRQRGDTIKAAAACRCALRAKPDFAEAFATLGMLYREHHRLEEALVCLEQALRIKPDLAEALYNMGITRQKMGDYRQGLDLYRKAVNNAPGFAPALWLFHLSLPMIYDNPGQVRRCRDRFQSHLDQLTSSTPLDTADQIQFAMRGISATTNFYLQYQCRNDLRLQTKYGRFVHRVMKAAYPHWTIEKPMPATQPGAPIRIGYVSTFMHDHTIGTFLAGWLESHHRDEFEIHCYHVGRKIDGLTERLRRLSHCFNHRAGDLEGTARQIKKDDLHVLVYTDIGMHPVTTQLAALRLAPVQCKGWGHPVTTGLPAIDYYLTSDLMEPENAAGHYSETLVRLPNLALCYRPPPLPANPKTRADLNIAQDRFIYLSTQSIFKYLPQHDDLYPRIALAAPKSCFVFIGNQSRHATGRLRKRFELVFRRYNLDAGRYCHFSPKLNLEDFLSLNLASDALLDTMEWSGGKTTLEAISCGLPVVTCPGRYMRGRHAYAMLRMMGATETVADDKSAYCAIAARLANDPPYYRRIKQQVAANRHKLYNDRNFMTALENFYRSVTGR